MTDREPGFYHVIDNINGGRATVWKMNDERNWRSLESGMMYEPGNPILQHVEIGPRIDRDETERLKARVAELEAALLPFADFPEMPNEQKFVKSHMAFYERDVGDGMKAITFGDLRRARTALKGSE